MELTPLQERIVALVTEGFTNREIAETLGMSEDTVKNQLSRQNGIYDKVGCSNRVELALWAVKRQEGGQ